MCCLRQRALAATRQHVAAQAGEECFLFGLEFRLQVRAVHPVAPSVVETPRRGAVDVRAAHVRTEALLLQPDLIAWTEPLWLLQVDGRIGIDTLDCKYGIVN
jgi:hypothetical protein